MTSLLKQLPLIAIGVLRLSCFSQSNALASGKSITPNDGLFLILAFNATDFHLFESPA